MHLPVRQLSLWIQSSLAVISKLPTKKFPSPLDSLRCLSSLSSPRPVDASEASIYHPRHSGRAISAFIKRTEAIRRVVHLLNDKPWNEGSPNALKEWNADLTPFVVSEVVRFCHDLDTALEFFRWWRTVEGNEADSWVYVAVMDRLGRAGRLEEMEAVASECETEGLVTVEAFTAQLLAYRNAGFLEGALTAWRRMEKFGIEPNLVSYTTMMDVFARLKMYDVAGDLYLHFLWEGFFPNVKTLTVLIHHLADGGKLDAATTIFLDLLKVKVKPNALTFVALMRGYAKIDNMDAVLDLVRRFMDVGNRPDGDDFSSLFRDLLTANRVEDAERVLEALYPGSSEEDRQATIVKYQNQAFHHASPGSLDMVTEDSYTDDEEDTENGRCMISSSSLWNYIGLVRCMSPWTPAVAAALERAHVRWDGYLVSELMKRIRRPDVGWRFFVWVEGQGGFSHDKYTYSRMIQLLLTESNFVRVKQLLLEAQIKQLGLPLYTYNNVLKFCGLKHEANIALEVFELMQRAGFEPDRVSYQNLIHALHKCGRYWRVATVCAEMERKGFDIDAAIYSFLVCGFAEVGLMKYAKAFYKRMRDRGFEPSEHIYVAFITGFCQTGKSDKAEEMFWQMKKDSIVPSVDIYDLMIEVFEKNGNKNALLKVKSERNSMQSANCTGKRKIPYLYLKFYQIFTHSFSEYDARNMINDDAEAIVAAA